jgi:hypothetical protein
MARQVTRDLPKPNTSLAALHFSPTFNSPPSFHVLHHPSFRALAASAAVPSNCEQNTCESHVVHSWAIRAVSSRPSSKSPKTCRYCWGGSNVTFVQNVPQHPFFLGRREQNEVVRNNDCIQTHITYRLIRFRFQSPYRRFLPYIWRRSNVILQNSTSRRAKKQ